MRETQRKEPPKYEKELTVGSDGKENWELGIVLEISRIGGMSRSE